LGRRRSASVEGTDTEKWLAFRTAFRELENRIKVFTSLPIRTLDRAKLQSHLHEIGRTRLDEAG
jgi:arsenate reductase